MSERISRHGKITRLVKFKIIQSGTGHKVLGRPTIQGFDGLFKISNVK